MAKKRCVNQITRNGNDAQKEKYLPKVCHGRSRSNVLLVNLKMNEIKPNEIFENSRPYITNPYTTPNIQHIHDIAGCVPITGLSVLDELFPVLALH